MFRIIMLCAFISLPFKLVADDADGNRVAAYIKERLISDIRYRYDGNGGFCNVMIKMNHKNGYAILEKVSTTGNSELCQFLKGRLVKGSRYRYDYPENLIQLDFEHF